MDILTSRLAIFNLQSPPPFGSRELLSWSDMDGKIRQFVTEEHRIVVPE